MHRMASTPHLLPILRSCFTGARMSNEYACVALSSATSKHARRQQSTLSSPHFSTYLGSYNEDRCLRQHSWPVSKIHAYGWQVVGLSMQDDRAVRNYPQVKDEIP